MIDFYSFGKIVIDGKTFTSDLIIFPETIHDNWWRMHGHLLQKDDLTEIIKFNPEVLIIGTGYNGLMQVPDDIKQVIKLKGIELIIKKTRKACDIYNKLVGKKKIVAAFHITC